MADIWSVACINPNSVASAVPARPANNSAVTTGPSSRRTPNMATAPSASADPKRCRSVALCSARIIPTNKPASMMMASVNSPAL